MQNVLSSPSRGRSSKGSGQAAAHLSLIESSAVSTSRLPANETEPSSSTSAPRILLSRQHWAPKLCEGEGHEQRFMNRRLVLVLHSRFLPPPPAVVVVVGDLHVCITSWAAGTLNPAFGFGVFDLKLLSSHESEQEGPENGLCWSNRRRPGRIRIYRVHVKARCFRRQTPSCRLRFSVTLVNYHPLIPTQTRSREHNHLK